MSETGDENVAGEPLAKSQDDQTANNDVFTEHVSNVHPDNPENLNSTVETSPDLSQPPPQEASGDSTRSTATKPVEMVNSDWIKTKTGPNETRVRHSSGDAVAGLILRSSTPPSSRPTSLSCESNGSNKEQSPPTQEPVRSRSGESVQERPASESGSSPRYRLNLDDHGKPVGPDVRRRSHRMRGSASAMVDLYSSRPSSAHRDTDYSPPNERRYSGTQLCRRRVDRRRGDNSDEETSDDLAKPKPVYGPIGRSPKDVENQSEEVFKNYMYERYNKDCLESEGERFPPPPSIINNFSPSAHSNLAQVGRQLAVIGDHIDHQYRNQFQDMAKLLSLRRDSGAQETLLDIFKSVCRRLFRDSISWGRVVALLQFGYHMAMNDLQAGIGDFMSLVITFLVRFIAEVKIFDRIRSVTVTITEWIANQGGWVAALDEVRRGFSPSPGQIAALGCMVVLIAGFVWWRQKS